MENVKEILTEKLMERNGFWSYDMLQTNEVLDDILIEKTLLYLDIDDIDKLFTIYSYKKIKQVWRDRLVIQDDYYRKLNKLLAWMYFDIKNPDQYIKRIVRQHIHKLT
ncbi:MAG: hypothetical protein WBI53_09925 [Paludibacter sp.]